MLIALGVTAGILAVAGAVAVLILVLSAYADGMSR